MPDVYILMGDHHIGKSSVIRALTGASGHQTRDPWRVETTNGQILEFFIQTRAPQEGKKQFPLDFTITIQNSRAPNILVSLWINGGQPKGLAYIKEFIKPGYAITIKEIVVLGAANLPYNLPQGVPQPRFIPYRKNQRPPINRIASQIRQWWGWL
jgi:hypothetical protein